MTTSTIKKEAVIKKIELPLFWRKEIKLWHGIISDLKNCYLVENLFTAGTNNIQYWEIEL